MTFSSPSTIRAFIREYARGDNWHNIDIRTADLGYGWIHYALIRTLRPRRVLAVGSKYGYIPAVCAAACKDNGGGMVDFVDAGYDACHPVGDTHWGGVGYWRTPQGKSAFKRFGLDGHIRLHVMTTAAFRARFGRRTWKYVYLDGDHSYDGVRSDYSSFYPTLETGGYLALHDIRTVGTNGDLYGVGRFWQELKQAHHGDCVEFPGEFGLGVIRKPYYPMDSTSHISRTRFFQLFSRAIRRLSRTWAGDRG